MPAKEVGMLKLSWLGLPVAEIDGIPIHFETRKVFALLAYLSLNPKGNSREKLATLFWPEYDQKHASNSLRRTLNSLIHALPADCIEVDRELVRWNEKVPVQIDVLEFQSGISSARIHKHEDAVSYRTYLDALIEVAALYGGDFLDSLNLPDCPAFDDWQNFTRESLKSDYAWVLEQMVEGWSNNGVWDKAVEAARRWVNLDKLDSKAQLALVKIYTLSGQRSMAQRQFDEFISQSKVELGQEPDEETLVLFKRILNQVLPPQLDTKPGQPTALQSSTILLKTKLYLPQVKPSWVSRPRLLSKLEAIPLHKLTLISAPAGFGKTSLLADWVSQTDHLVGWFSLDAGDNDPNRFLTYLSAVFDNLIEGIAANARSMLESRQPFMPHAILTVLLNDLEKIKEPAVVVLDDYQFLTKQPIHETCAYLVERATPNLHLVIISRVDPPLPLARLRSQGELLEIRTDDLRFTLKETETFYHKVMELNLSTEGIRSLSERTEGWVVGLQMAGISLRGSADHVQFFRTFSGSHRYILDYLMQEVLDQQTEHVRDFLLKTSVLEQMCGELCNYVVGESIEPAFRTLEYLERANLFLVPLDEERIWYRYHHLFADLLRARLQRTVKIQDIAVLHTRAAQWYEQNGFTYEAIQHASLTSNNEWVERLIDQNHMEMFQRKDASSIRFWTGGLSKELIYKRPLLCIHEAMNRSWLGRLDEADVFLNEAEKRISEEETTPETQAMLGHIAYIRSRGIAMRGDVQRAIKLCLFARECTPVSNQALLGGIGVMLGYGYFLDGDFPNANHTLNETIQSGVIARAINTTMAAYCVLARLFAIQGQLYRSLELYQEAEKFANEVGGQLVGIMGIVDVGIAGLLYEWNDLEAALTHMKRGMEFIPYWSKADDIALAYVTHARIQQAQGDMSAALETIEKGSQVILTSGVFSEARGAVATTRIRLQLSQVPNQAVSRWISFLENDLRSGDPFRFENELAYMMLAKAYLVQKKPEEAIGLLSCLEENAHSGGRTGRLIEILILKALVMLQLDEPAQALSTLTRSLALAEPEGFTRIFVDEGEPMRKLLAQWLLHNADSPLRSYAIQLLSQFDPDNTRILINAQKKGSLSDDLMESEGRSVKAMLNDPVVCIEPLTERELQVLQLLAEGLSNKEIAEKLVVAIGTVKSHTSNIYRKMDVLGRTKALAKARAYHLI
jgi:LuxR family maltose regulon positive regulatory protein